MIVRRWGALRTTRKAPVATTPEPRVATVEPASLPVVFVPAGGLPVPPVRGGGVERYIASLAVELNKLGFPVQILDRAWPAAERLSSAAGPLLREIRSPHLEFRFQRAGRLWALLFVLVETFNEVGFALSSRFHLRHLAGAPHVVTCQSSRAALVFLIWNPANRLITYTSHSSRRYDYSRSAFDRFAIWMENYVARRVSLALVSTVKGRDQLMQDSGGLRANVRVLPTNCVEIDRYGQDSRAERPETAVVRALYVGRVRPNKGFHVLVEAVGVLDRRLQQALQITVVGPDEEFARMGSSSYGAHVRRQMASKGLIDSFVFVGEVPVDELVDLYHSSDFLVMPSLAESAPRAIVEALASGLPVVATRVGTIPEQIVSGETGLLTEPGDSRALAAAITWMITHREERAIMGLRGRRQAEELSWPKLARRIADAYLELATGDQPAPLDP